MTCTLGRRPVAAPRLRSGAEADGHVELGFAPMAHHFRKRRRVCLQVSPGAHLLLMRELGAEDPIPATTLSASDQHLRAGAGWLSLSLSRVDT